MVVQLYAPQNSGGEEPAEAVTVVDSGGVVLLRVSWRAESPERARVIVEGDVDQDTAPALRAMLLDALAQRRLVCCDLRLASFLGSAGVETLAQAHVAAAEGGRWMVLTGIAGIVERVLQLTGMLDVLSVER